MPSIIRSDRPQVEGPVAQAGRIGFSAEVVAVAGEAAVGTRPGSPA
ncbi:MAG TPA: hypothetical protein VGI64_21585 [Streptosporangiaceae bacterium]|jgi:hypothetical protein